MNGLSMSTFQMNSGNDFSESIIPLLDIDMGDDIGTFPGLHIHCQPTGWIFRLSLPADIYNAANEPDIEFTASGHFEHIESDSLPAELATEKPTHDPAADNNLRKSSYTARKPQSKLLGRSGISVWQ